MVELKAVRLASKWVESSVANLVLKLVGLLVDLMDTWMVEMLVLKLVAVRGYSLVGL